MLRDLIEIIKPGFIPHSNTFLRPLSNPSSNSAAQFTSCTPRGGERASLMINSCLAPDSGTLFGAGLIQNAYNYVLEASEALMSSGTSGTSKAVIIGAAVGGAVGGAVLLALVAVVGLFMRRRRVLAKRNRADEEGVELPEMEKRESGESERSIANNAAAPGQNEGEADVPVPPVEVAVGPAQEGEVPRRSPNGRKMWWKR